MTQMILWFLNQDYIYICTGMFKSKIRLMKTCFPVPLLSRLI